MPTVNPRGGRRTPASVQGRRALRIVLIIAAIVAVLLAAWWGLSYVNKANVAAPVADTPSSRPAVATTAATTAAAPSSNTVAILVSKPCKALTAGQAASLGVQSPGQQGPPSLCSWSGKAVPGVTVSAVSGSDGYQQRIDDKASYAHFELIEVSNHQAVQSGTDGTCDVTVRISANESFNAGSSGPASDASNPHGCAKAKATAAAVLANF